MCVGSDLITVGHFEPNREVAGGSHRVTLQDSQLRAGRQEGRRRSKFNLIGRESILSRSGLASEKPRYEGESEDENPQFHESLLMVTT
jgi:hypothetical protein